MITSRLVILVIVPRPAVLIVISVVLPPLGPLRLMVSSLCQRPPLRRPPPRRQSRRRKPGQKNLFRRGQNFITFVLALISNLR
jgi:hypothetical protein